MAALKRSEIVGGATHIRTPGHDDSHFPEDDRKERIEGYRQCQQML